MTGVTKRRKGSALTRTAVAAAVVLGVGVAGVTVAGVVGSDRRPALAAHSASTVFDPLSLIPTPADRPATKKPGKKSKSKPKAKRPGQRNNARPRRNATPGVGRVCGRAQANRIRTAQGRTTVCTHMGSGRYRWVRVTGVDPQVRKPGGKCTGQYTTARGPRGKAMVCARGRWTARF
ncbi:hypothetical protein GOARA_021_01400 [Gordonia araii NBRC 100433]|uniref:Uncharacterized protein n=1 Tax=Gordonia araii NBRC 100433 TaxID=1073574 RepID=G7GZ77_9ACTN|nr:hypothetical protein [Gordonia araii]NNG97110.1 hypothetical protein [Gordonia araii NBRC 100433]GAB08902.1 hypothetical protein GOARA_021_01400 [Gordonia araii NBRC 100433]